MVLCGRPLVKILCMRYGHSPQVVWKPNGKCNSTRLALTVRCKLFRQLSDPLFFLVFKTSLYKYKSLTPKANIKEGRGRAKPTKVFLAPYQMPTFVYLYQKKCFCRHFEGLYYVYLCTKKGEGGLTPTHPLPRFRVDTNRLFG